MEFLLYLNSDGKEIYNLVSRKVRIVENPPICRQYNAFGWYDSKKRVLSVCTEAIKSSPDPRHYANETIYHESVHVAQSCKSGDGYMEPFGISKSSMPLSDFRKNGVNVAVNISGPIVRDIEHEAFWMEDKPDKVNYVIKKYCF